jgi:hypothetical protein
LANILSEDLGETITEEAVERWLQANGGSTPYEADQFWTGDLSEETWIVKVWASKLLSKLFPDLSEGRLEFQKPAHSVRLTNWLLTQEPEHMRPLIRYVSKLVQ